MRTFFSRLGGVLILGLFLLGMHAATTSADDGAPTYVPAANVKNIMNAMNSEETGLFAMIQSTCKTIEKSDSTARNLMRHRVAMLEESGNILAHLGPSKGEPASWRKHAYAFRDAVEPMKKQIIKKRYVDLRKQLLEVEKQCKACHTAHRSE